ncbi:hypothetical protein VKT23_001562 [Stygiomarasmius scandens]|uniref:Uncharacterized protein n=1 Tax=Marasmiellus scandens TaxID=2682957 RepID=A0ABR1K1C7_9AGAR
MIPTPPSTSRKRPHCTTCHKPMRGHARGQCASRAVSLPANLMTASLSIQPSFNSNTTPSRSSSPLSVIPDKDGDEDDKLSVRELDYPPTTPNHKNTSDHKPTLPEPVAVIYDDRANPLVLQSRPNTHFGVLLTKHSDGNCRQWFVSGEKSIVRKIVTGSANSMPGRIAKDSEMQEYPVIVTYTRLIFSCILVSIFVVIGMSFI